MNYSFTGRRFDITDTIREKATKKVDKLSKFFDDSAEAKIIITKEKNGFAVELTINQESLIFRACERGEEIIDIVSTNVDIIERKIRKNKTRLHKNLRKNSFDNFDFARQLEKAGTQDENTDEKDEEFKVVKRKRFSIKPMSTTEAILQMNMISHPFFVFKDSESFKVNIVYKRKDGDFGLIETDDIE